MSFIEHDPSLDEPYAEYETVAEEFEELFYPARRRKSTERARIERRLRRNKHRLIGRSAVSQVADKTAAEDISSDLEEFTVEEFSIEPIIEEGVLHIGENTEPVEAAHELSHARLLNIVHTAAEEKSRNTGSKR